MVESVLKIAFVVYQAASLAVAGTLIAQRPLDVALGAVGVTIPALLIWWGFKASARRRACRQAVNRRLNDTYDA